MTLYLNNKKIKDAVDYGLQLYYNNQFYKIKEAYLGSQLVYRYQPYAPTTAIIYSANTGTRTLTLDIGYYKIALCGAKGNNSSWAYGGYAWGAPGGGGGFVELVFYNATPQTYTIYSSTTGDSYMNLNESRMITAGGGTNAGVNVAGNGGTITVSTSLNVIKTIKSTTGNKGSVALASIQSIATVSTYDNWGSTANTNGGARLEYLGQSYS